MQVQRLSRKVTSKTQVRSSSGSSKLTHSWASAGARGTGPEAAPMAVGRAGAAARSATSCRVAVILGVARARSLPGRGAAGWKEAGGDVHHPDASEVGRGPAPPVAPNTALLLLLLFTAAALFLSL